MITIIGGGIAGLAAAHELSRRRHPFVLLEASRRLGGLIRTEHVEGFTLDAGADSILGQKPAAVQLCEELGLGPRLMSTRLPRTAFVLKNGQLYPLPSPSVLGVPASVSATCRYDLLSWSARARILLEPFVPPGTAVDESVASFFRRRFGGEMVELIAQPLLGGIHAGDVEQLSVSSLFPRLIEAERKPGRLIRNLAKRGDRGGEGLFRGLRGGMEELVAAIAAALPPDSIRLATAATAVRQHVGAWRVEHVSGSRDSDAVIVAAPAAVAARLIDGLDPDAAEICRSVPYVSTASVALGFKRRDVGHPLEGSGFVVARRHNSVRMTACTWVSSKWNFRAPPDCTLLRVFVGGSHDPKALDLRDDELKALATRELGPVLRLAGAAIVSRVFRWKNAGAQHVVGHLFRMTDLRERLRRFPGLFLVGSGFDSIGIPDCVAHGRRAAAAAVDYITMKT